MLSLLDGILNSSSKDKGYGGRYSKEDVDLIKSYFFNDESIKASGELTIETIKALLAIADMERAVNYLNDQTKFFEVNDNLIKSLNFLVYCESVLEKVFFLALIGELMNSFLSINCIEIHCSGDALTLFDEPKYDYSNGEFTQLSVKPKVEIYLQEKIDNYRVDFLVKFYTGTEQNILVTEGSYKYMKKVKNVCKNFIIEIDGHYFHEKTKEQSQRDKKRDRDLTLKGYKIFHFTGSEIYNDIYSCTHQIVYDALFNTFMDETHSDSDSEAS